MIGPRPCSRKTLWVALGISAVLGALVLPRIASADEADTDTAGATAQDTAQELGHAHPGATVVDRSQWKISGCMVASCHGSRDPEMPTWQRAGAKWFDDDPHAQAYTALLSDRSKQIVERLTGKSLAVDSTAYRDLLERKCVSCHASELAPTSQRVLGADCQVCHGPATAWGEEHYSKQRRELGEERFLGTERVHLGSLSQRVRVCSSCHVGQLNRDDGQDREVDHRLMAAGHPVTYFDFENYFARYPAHWDVARENARLGPSAPYQRWRTGKLVAAQTRLALVRDRAVRASPHLGQVAPPAPLMPEPIAQSLPAESLPAESLPAESLPAESLPAESLPEQVWPQHDWPQHDWPEFTEYSCTSCHHELSNGAWRQAYRSHSRFVWDEWSMELVDLAMESTVEAEIDSVWVSQMAALRADMQQRTPPIERVAATADALWNHLEQRSATLQGPVSEAFLRAQLQRLIQLEPSVSSWEKGAQWASAARVLTESMQWQPNPRPLGVDTVDAYFGPPQIWIPGQLPAFQTSEWFHPRSLTSYRDSLKEQLGTRP
jgi:hypothetical protein